MFICGLASIGLLTLTPLALAMCLFVPLKPTKGPDRTLHLDAAIMWLAGFACSYVLAWLLFDWELSSITLRCLFHHMQWADWNTEPGSLMSFGLVNLLEFALWTGIPIVTLATGYLLRPLGTLDTRVLRPENGLLLSGLVVLLFSAFFGGCTGEVNRLWIFLVPLVCVLAAAELTRWPKKTGRWLVIGLCILQMTLVHLTKAVQDFS
jgi:hypothetical protein